MLISKIEKTGIPFQKSMNPIADYSPYTITDNLIFISGQLPIVDNKLLYEGKIGFDISEENAKKSIQVSIINLLAVLDFVLKENMISFNCLKILNIKGYLNVSSDFKNHSKLFDSASEILIKIFGKKNGMHSRSVIGVKNLPLNSPVEIDGIISYEKST